MCLSHSAKRFHLVKIWATKFSNRRKRVQARRLSGSIACNALSVKTFISQPDPLSDQTGIEPRSSVATSRARSCRC